MLVGFDGAGGVEGAHGSVPRFRRRRVRVTSDGPFQAAASMTTFKRQRFRSHPVTGVDPIAWTSHVKVDDVDARGRGHRLFRPRELDEEPDRTLRLHPMPHFRNDDRARCRTDLERAVDRWTDVIAQHPADHVDPGPYATLGGVLGPEPGRNRRLVELRRPAAGDASVGPLHPVAAHAIELGAQHRLAPGLAHHPRTAHEGRTVAYVLAVGAIEIRDPVPVLVEVKADDRALHRYTAPLHFTRLAWRRSAGAPEWSRLDFVDTRPFGEEGSTLPKSRPPFVCTEPAPAGGQPRGRLRRPSGARGSSWLAPGGLRKSWLVNGGVVAAPAQRPFHTGSRFSAKARNPSIWSSLS